MALCKFPTCPSSSSPCILSYFVRYFTAQFFQAVYHVSLLSVPPNVFCQPVRSFIVLSRCLLILYLSTSRASKRVPSLAQKQLLLCFAYSLFLTMFELGAQQPNSTPRASERAPFLAHQLMLCSCAPPKSQVRFFILLPFFQAVFYFPTSLPPESALPLLTSSSCSAVLCATQVIHLSVVRPLLKKREGSLKKGS